MIEPELSMFEHKQCIPDENLAESDIDFGFTGEGGGAYIKNEALKDSLTSENFKSIDFITQQLRDSQTKNYASDSVMIDSVLQEIQILEESLQNVGKIINEDKRLFKIEHEVHEQTNCDDYDGLTQSHNGLMQELTHLEKQSGENIDQMVWLGMNLKKLASEKKMCETKMKQVESVIDLIENDNDDLWPEESVFEDRISKFVEFVQLHKLCQILEGGKFVEVKEKIEDKLKRAYNYLCWFFQNSIEKEAYTNLRDILSAMQDYDLDKMKILEKELFEKVSNQNLKPDFTLFEQSKKDFMKIIFYLKTQKHNLKNNSIRKNLWLTQVYPNNESEGLLKFVNYLGKAQISPFIKSMLNGCKDKQMSQFFLLYLDYFAEESKKFKGMYWDDIKRIIDNELEVYLESYYTVESYYQANFLKQHVKINVDKLNQNLIADGNNDPRKLERDADTPSAKQLKRSTLSGSKDLDSFSGVSGQFNIMKTKAKHKMDKIKHKVAGKHGDSKRKDSEEYDESTIGTAHNETNVNSKQEILTEMVLGEEMESLFKQCQESLARCSRLSASHLRGVNVTKLLKLFQTELFSLLLNQLEFVKEAVPRLGQKSTVNVKIFQILSYFFTISHRIEIIYHENLSELSEMDTVDNIQDLKATITKSINEGSIQIINNSIASFQLKFENILKNLPYSSTNKIDLGTPSEACLESISFIQPYIKTIKSYFYGTMKEMAQNSIGKKIIKTLQEHFSEINFSGDHLVYIVEIDLSRYQELINDLQQVELEQKFQELKALCDILKERPEYIDQYIAGEPLLQNVEPHILSKYKNTRLVNSSTYQIAWS